MKYYLAIDLGASSGRHVVGYLKDGKIRLDEVHRFRTCMDDSKNGLVWDIPRFFREIIQGIKKAFGKYREIESLSIDTWGVDYILMNKDKEIPPYYAYRNKRCLKAAEKVHEIIPFEQIYKLTGIQFASFNTIYQLFDDKEMGRIKNATDYLMLPSYFIYKLTGKKTHEYTDESTGGFINPKTKKYSFELIEKIGLPKRLFTSLNMPGETVGKLLPEIEKEVGGNCTVVLCASHDTASAFESIEVDEESLILSSGTWSLLGIKSKDPIINKDSLNANYTNEGGVNYIRFLKNIMGMYLTNQVMEEVNLSFDEISKGLEKSTYKETFSVNDPSLNAPKNMKLAILNLLKEKPPKSDYDLFASIYHSMAKSYKESINEIERITNKKFKKIYVIGGGAKNDYLNTLIKEYTKLDVIAMPIEATSLGNIKVQMKVSKEL